MPCKPVRGGVLCSGNRGIAPRGMHFGWDEDVYPVITDDPDNVIDCACGEPAITCDFWAYELSRTYCEACAWVHMDVLPKARRKRKRGEMLDDDKEGNDAE